MNTFSKAPWRVRQVTEGHYAVLSNVPHDPNNPIDLVSIASKAGDAALIAAAPDLLKALLDITNDVKPLVVPMGNDHENPFPLQYPPLIEQARKAINKALGGGV